MNRRLLGALALTILATAPQARTEGAPTAVINAPAEGSVSRPDGLRAFDRIYEVVSHPRCANCHTGPENIPMWYGGSAGHLPAQRY